MKTNHPRIYKKANVSQLSKYIKKAEEQGIVRVGAEKKERWAELMPAYRDGDVEKMM